MTPEFALDGPHWRFALALYRQPGVKDACLRLQDEAGLDVVLMIAALYAACDRAACPPMTEIAAAYAGVSKWREASVLPLRAARRALKSMESSVPDGIRESFRNRVKALELEAEQIELAALVAGFAAGRSKPQGNSAVADDLAILIRDVLAAQGADPAEGLEAAMATIAGAAVRAFA